MNKCGVELAGSDAVLCFLNVEREQFTLPDTNVRKLSLPKRHTRSDLQQFQTEFARLMDQFDIHQVAIRERMPKGKFAGGAISFKLESAIQLIDKLDVILLQPIQIKSTLSEHPLPIPFAATGLKSFQEGAFHIAYAAHMQP